MVKLYIISVIQGSMTIYNTAFEKEVITLKITFLLGLVIVGNVVDNISHLNWVVIIF